MGVVLMPGVGGSQEPGFAGSITGRDSMDPSSASGGHVSEPDNANPPISW